MALPEAIPDEADAGYRFDAARLLASASAQRLCATRTLSRLNLGAAEAVNES